MMKALTYLKPGVIAWKQVAKPKLLKPTDAIGKVLTTTICGSDLHIIKGDVPETTAIASLKPDRGIILGHEAVVKLTEVGKDVKSFKPGDVCLLSCISSCGDCYYCKRNLQAHCTNNGGTTGGWIFGHDIDGTQAEFVRIPVAENSMYKVPKGISNETILMLSDAMPTSFEVGVISGQVKKNDVVAIVGLGPVGLGALLTAKTLNPSKIIAIDMDEGRLEVAKKFGATHTFNPTKSNILEEINTLTTYDDGRKTGVDVAIECVGVPATFELCEDLICPGGSIANVGVHGKSVELKLQDLWIKNIKITTGLVSTYSIPQLMKKVVSGDLDPSVMITHRFKLDEFEKAYEVSKNASKTKAIKIVLTADDA